MFFWGSRRWVIKIVGDYLQDLPGIIREESDLVEKIAEVYFSYLWGFFRYHDVLEILFIHISVSVRADLALSTMKNMHAILN